MRLSAAVLLLTVPTLPFTQARAVPVPSHFGSSGADRTAIEALLGLYTKAVSNKDQALFETLLLNRNIPFSFVGSATGALAADGGHSITRPSGRGCSKGRPSPSVSRMSISSRTVPWPQCPSCS